MPQCMISRASAPRHDSRDAHGPRSALTTIEFTHDLRAAVLRACGHEVPPASRRSPGAERASGPTRPFTRTFVFARAARPAPHGAAACRPSVWIREHPASTSSSNSSLRRGAALRVTSSRDRGRDFGMEGDRRSSASTACAAPGRACPVDVMQLAGTCLTLPDPGNVLEASLPQEINPCVDPVSRPCAVCCLLLQRSALQRARAPAWSAAQYARRCHRLEGMARSGFR